MLNHLSRVSQQVGLCMNMSKTKIMSNTHVPFHTVIVGSSALEIVDEYLGHTVQLGRSNFEKEVNRRIQLGNIETSASDDSRIGNVLAYYESHRIRRLRITQRAMEIAML
ncbi:jg8876 [Pararge aegeria aegeria]|uniref:Jg8876 protein n=1 Tax=Pararge aegeria aegeria TaxID=348720 RepID=A0A8S4R675_9NEOP|nr:jg8876 [Pararge aegeria aegeria]